ncbi:MAG: hypothetical protein A3H17_04120 [Candidatus Levybacteria bacterium RIFCSPLOWO2_12_FULL_37_14]|nr:MAG: hypothetical protein A3H17_04120 [Candidatus Levybacteria bacterium RIFCSPLOWO2_12_FULL_37_14]
MKGEKLGVKEMRGTTPARPSQRDVFRDILNKTAGHTSVDIPTKTGKLKSPIRRFLGGTAAKIILAGLAAAGVGVGIKAAYEVNNPTPQKIEISSTFDPALTEQQMIDSNNLIQMILPEAEKAAPPIWQEESKTLTIVLPIMFDRTPTLLAKKVTLVPNNEQQVLETIRINGLQKGDIIISPFDGKLKGQIGKEGKQSTFSIHMIDSEGKDIYVWISTAGSNPIIIVEKDVFGNNKYIDEPIDVTKGQPIVEIASTNKESISNSQVQISGIGPNWKTFNLATTSEGKVIILK